MENPRVFVVLSSVMFYLASTAMLPGEGDLDRWQLHQMAAEAIESNKQYFTSTEGGSVSAGEQEVPEATVQETSIPTISPQMTGEAIEPAPVVVEASPPPLSASSKSKKSWFAKRKKEPTIECLREEAHALAKKGLKYQFGSDDPKSGGLDCSATVQYLYSSLGIQGVPRTSYLQYEWLKKAGTLHEVKGKNSTRQLLKRLRPGDLIFWGGTWKSGHKVSHVMIYLGRNPDTGEHFVFGARGKRVEGLLGSGVDVFVLNPDRGTLVGHGRVPGMRNS